MNRYLPVLLALAAVIAAPMILRPRESARTSDYAEQDRLIVITPHVETLRYELERGFAAWMKEKHQRTVVIDWRVPGGTSDIIKVVNSEFKAADTLKQGSGIGLDLMLGGGPIDYSGLKKSGYIEASSAQGKYGPVAVQTARTTSRASTQRWQPSRTSSTTRGWSMGVTCRRDDAGCASS